MRFNPKLILSLLVTVPSTMAAVNGSCTGRNGICIATNTCTKYGGQSFVGKCPKDPNNIKCCDNIPCKANGVTGSCMFENQCSGQTVAGLCPGGNNFKCCIPKPTPVPAPNPSKDLKSLVISLLKHEEGTNLRDHNPCSPYVDSNGYPTIGYGHKCSDTKLNRNANATPYCTKYTNGCNKAKMEKLLSDDIDSKTSCILSKNYSNLTAAYNKASIYRKAIITSMAFQLGCSGLNNFTKTINYMKNGNWNAAATEMLDSKWARTDSPDRAKRHSYVIRNNYCGKDFCSLYGW